MPSEKTIFSQSQVSKMYTSGQTRGYGSQSSKISINNNLSYSSNSYSSNSNSSTGYVTSQVWGGSPIR